MNTITIEDRRGTINIVYSLIGTETIFRFLVSALECAEYAAYVHSTNKYYDTDTSTERDIDIRSWNGYTFYRIRYEP